MTIHFKDTNPEDVFLMRLFSEQWFKKQKSGGAFSEDYREKVRRKIYSLSTNGFIDELEREFIDLRCGFTGKVHTQNDIAQMEKFFGGKTVTQPAVRSKEARLFKKLRKEIHPNEFMRQDIAE
ncbi:MAG: hypothetical protein UU80_C0016G0013 [candidate division WWE3 bacterium GW2011_GWA1_41_8]|uniref:Uncharacterized protein n=3 Tax=Katanobacteria TaxID=422282 RepID=A0A0G0ZIV0_UNCKA|nr:MAG: hypothetical protein UU72_C0008G0041 [candidate division WWE3 bacterium GW2011_GWB1_41_6]KKS21981.1 MAG: hypothetical protein UU80_C0016G0013 [candidate division WWE3 bacterium GW2011_GWA1_41_8]OGC56794.1 MAG: hypothetical protein A2976_01510 [candidate division WWE3 bacterium RIFCSPLOWO2_01_FULL_41_9]